MATPSGYSSIEKDLDVSAKHVTVERVSPKQVGLSVRIHGHKYSAATDTTEASSTTKVLNATAHAAKPGDTIRFTSATATVALQDTESVVDSVTANTITLSEVLEATPGLDDFAILRNRTPTINADGSAIISSGPVSFTRDAATQVVTEDTVTPANNRPLPVKLTDFSGDMVLNAANLNLETQLDHNSANPDSIQIGDGTETMNINASNEAQVRDDDANTTLTAMNAKFVTGTDIGDVTINNAAGASSVNIQDGGNSITIDAAALPLPTGAATEATLATAAGDTTSIDAKTPALGLAATAASVPVTLSSDHAALPLPTGASTEATLSTLNAKFVTGTDIGDVTINNAAAGAAVNIQDGGNSITIDNAEITSIDGKLPATLGQKASAASMAVVIASDQSALPVSLSGGTDVIDFFDTPLVEGSSINGSGGAFTEVIASTAAATTSVQLFDTTGDFLGWYTGAAASEVLAWVTGPGMDGTTQVAIPITTRVSVRGLDTAVSGAGQITANFIG